MLNAKNQKFFKIVSLTILLSAWLFASQSLGQIAYVMEYLKPLQSQEHPKVTIDQDCLNAETLMRSTYRKMLWKISRETYQANIAGDKTSQVLQITEAQNSTCFSGDTKVTLVAENGDLSSIPIAEVQEGDIVLSYNHQTGKPEPDRVVFKRTKEVALTCQLKVNGLDVKLRVTGDHPFFTVSEVPMDRLFSESELPVIMSSLDNQGISYRPARYFDSQQGKFTDWQITIFEEAYLPLVSVFYESMDKNVYIQALNNSSEDPLKSYALEEYSEPKYETVYTLRVENNKNYFAEGILVHNKGLFVPKKINLESRAKRKKRNQLKPKSSDWNMKGYIGY